MDTIEMEKSVGRQEQLTVEGFTFYTERDAQLAMQEQKKIEYLEKRMDYNNLESILQIYKKAVWDRIFKTPVGLFYLKNLQQFLLEQQELAGRNIPAIPLYVTFDGEIRENLTVTRNRIEPSKKKKQSNALPLSILMNIALVVAVIVMFVITLNSDQPNILNYEKALTNRYAGWEQELTEREQVIREKERELKLGEYAE